MDKENKDWKKFLVNIDQYISAITVYCDHGTCCSYR